MSKLTTDVLLKESIKTILTELVNSTYDWQEYTDEEIGQIVELDPTQVAELSAVINDSVAATNKVYSSQHTKELIQESLIEANKYSDDLVANLSNIKLDIVDILPDFSTVDKSTIYILKDSSGGTDNTLNVWSDTTSAFIEVGKLNVSMDNYYTKSEVDTELAKKANADEVLKPDAIVTDLTTTSGSTTLSTVGLQTELDKKANDDEVVKTTDIVTTIDSTSTDAQVPSAKITYEAINKILNGAVLNEKTDLNDTSEITQPREWSVCYFKANALNAPKTGIYGIIINYSSLYANDYNQWILDNKGRLWARVALIGSNQANGTNTPASLDDVSWTCITGSVDDIPVTSLAWAETTYFENSYTGCFYQVKNGVCFVNIDMTCNAPMTGGYKLPLTLPKPATQYVHFSVSSLPNAANETSSITIAIAGSGTQVRAYGGVATHRYLGMLSYPVAES